jgi:RNA polymerase sigma-70 factor, ECF subfamily
MLMDEGTLVREAMAGDREAFAGLVRLHQARLRALAALSIPGRDDVHDVVQETFIDAWRALARFDAGREFGPWLRSICRNRINGFLRLRLIRRRRELALVDEALIASAVPEEDGAEAERQVIALRICLDGLDTASRQLLYRRYHDEEAVQDLASGLGKSANSISMVLIRIKAALMRCVSNRLAGETP